MSEVQNANFAEKAEIEEVGGDFIISQRDKDLVHQEVSVKKDLTQWARITEENKQKIGATLGWGALGAILLGPLGFALGAFLGGRKKYIYVAASFVDDKKCVLELSPDDYNLLFTIAPTPETVVKQPAGGFSFHVSFSGARRIGVSLEPEERIYLTFPHRVPIFIGQS